MTTVDPDYALISAGINNRFGHPDPVVLARPREVGGVKAPRRDRKGTATIVTDAQRLWVGAER